MEIDGIETLTETFNTISVHEGDRFQIALRSSPSRGYHWTVEDAAGKVSWNGHDYLPDPGESMARNAGSVIQLFGARAAQAGTVDLVATYAHEDSGHVANSCKFKVQVTK